MTENKVGLEAGKKKRSQVAAADEITINMVTLVGNKCALGFSSKRAWRKMSSKK